jgi:hypothetical protein
MLSGQAVTSSVSPPDLQPLQISLLPPVLWDEVPAGSSFGEVVVQPLSTYLPGQAVEAVFRCEPCGGEASSRHPASLGWGRLLLLLLLLMMMMMLARPAEWCAASVVHGGLHRSGVWGHGTGRERDDRVVCRGRFSWWWCCVWRDQLGPACTVLVSSFHKCQPDLCEFCKGGRIIDLRPCWNRCLTGVSHAVSHAVSHEVCHLQPVCCDRSGNPRNNVRRGGSFLAVQRHEGATWTTVATDHDWSTHFYWERHFILSAQSFATVRSAVGRVRHMRPRRLSASGAGHQYIMPCRPRACQLLL